MMTSKLLLGALLVVAQNAASASIVLNFGGVLTTAEARVCTGPSYECTTKTSAANIPLTYSLAFDYNIDGTFNTSSLTSTSGRLIDQAGLFPAAMRTEGLIFAPQNLVPAFGAPNMTETEFLAGQGPRHYAEWTQVQAFRTLVRNADGTVRFGDVGFNAIATQDWFSQLADGTYRMSVTQLVVEMLEEATSTMTVDLVYSRTTEDEFYGNMTRWFQSQMPFSLHAVDFRADSSQYLDSTINYWGTAHLASVERTGESVPEPGTGWLALVAVVMFLLTRREGSLAKGVARRGAAPCDA